MRKKPAIFLSILLAIGVFSIIPSPIRVNASSSLAIDGSSIQGCDHSTNSCVATLSTSHLNDTIIVYTYEALDLQTSCAFSVSDTAGLSWNLRAQVSGRNDGTTAGNRDQMAEFWAHSQNPLNNDSITESISGCAGSYGGEYNGLTVFGVAGAKTNNPFDPNASVPSTASGNSNNPSTTVSTSSQGDLIVGSGLQSSYQITSGPGFTPLQSGWLNSVVEYKQTSSTVTGLPVTFGDSTTWYWEIIADALQPASFTPPPPGFTVSATNLVTVTAGNSVNELVIISGVGNFTGTVSLTAAIVPSTASSPSLKLNSSQVNVPVGSSGSTTLTVITNSSTTAGRYNLTISGSSVFGGKTIQANFVGTVVVQFRSNTFAMSASPTFLSVVAGSSATSSITLRGQNLTTTLSVYLSVQLPVVTGLNSSLSPTSIVLSYLNASSNSTLTIKTLSSVPAGNYTFTVTGIGGTFSNSLTFILHVKLPPVLALTTSLTVGKIYFPGDTAVELLQVTSVGVPVSSSALQLTVTLTKPDNTKLVLSTTPLGSGLFRTTYPLSNTAQVGTYSIQAVAHLTGASDGPALGSFEVMQPGLSAQTTTGIMLGGLASTVTAVGSVLICWGLGVFGRPRSNHRR